MSTTPPQTLGPYQIIREIARSNDIVYEAYDPRMNRRVALKELAVPSGSTGQQTEERIRRFMREAQAAGSLNHPNIMTVYSFAEEHGRHFMAMEYLDGCTLRNEIDTKGTVPLPRAVEIARGVLRGLAHSHAKGVIHRDIKPDNIQLTSDGGVKITDFGIARLTFQPNLTLDGQVFGTPSYMSPEQIVGKEIDARSDLFSVGVMLYEMLSGQKAFPGDGVVTITYAIMNKEPDRIANVPDPVWRVISRALSKTPNQRFADADEFEEALRGAVEQGVAPYSPAAPVAPATYGYNPLPTIPPGQWVGSQWQAAPNPGLNGSVPGNPNVQAGLVGNPPPDPAQNPYANPYNYPAQQQAMPPVPVFYPPPPRRPLLSDEASILLRRLVVTTLMIGTLFALVVVGVSELTKAVERYNNERADRELIQRYSRPATGANLDNQIQQLDDLRGRLKSESQRDAADRNLAALYEAQGREFLAKRDLIRAESAFRSALELVPQSAPLATNLASLYMDQAQRQPDAGQRMRLNQQAAPLWLQAARLETDGTKAATYSRAAAQSALAYAADVITADMSSASKARELLTEVRGVLATGSQELQAVDQMLARLR